MKRILRILAGFVVGALALVGLGTAIYALLMVSEKEHVPHGVILQDSAQGAQAPPQPRPGSPPEFRYAFPLSVYKSPYLLLKVVQTETDGSSRLKRGISGSGREYEPDIIVNVVFFNPGSQDSRLLFDRPVFIQGLSCPGSINDSGQTKILLEVLTRDSNHDGVINAKDNSVLFCSELDGTGLTQITSDSVSVVQWQFAERRHSVVIEVKRRPRDPSIEEGSWPRRLLWYNLVARSFTYRQLDTLISRAGKIVLQ